MYVLYQVQCRDHQVRSLHVAVVQNVLLCCHSQLSSVCVSLFCRG